MCIRDSASPASLAPAIGGTRPPASSSPASARWVAQALRALKRPAEEGKLETLEQPVAELPISATRGT
eukprot:11322529-Alexandrium_andersonii.AAC.1